MYYVQLFNGHEEFAYNWPDAVAQAKDMSDLYRSRVDVRPVGVDDVIWSCYPMKEAA